MASGSKRIIKTFFSSFITGLTLLTLSVGPLSSAIAQVQSQKPEAEAVPEERSPIESLGSQYHNSIELLRNRFRIDNNVKEVTMVFFREYGSAPVVLVRPDGSKIFQSQIENKDVDWYDSDTYDMIKIKNPVAGPWQAVGQVMTNSRVMVVSDIALHADPLPQIMFSGEILKSTAYLTNGGEPVKFNQFRDVVELTIEFVSTNNPNYDNFGANNQMIATFEDNGRGMDEAPMDGTFTGQFNLSVAPGEWRPVFRVTTPMFTREQTDPVIRLYPNPVHLSVVMDGGGPGYNKLVIDVDRDLVDIKSLLVDGKVRFPNGDIQNFSITEPSENPREHLIIAYEEGVYRVKLTAYGTTSDGRDFILDVPEYSFLGEKTYHDNLFDSDIETAMVPEEDSTDSDEGLPELTPEELAELEAMSAPDPAMMGIEVDDGSGMGDDSMMMIVLLINGAIVVIGGLVVGIVLWRRRTPKTKANSDDAKKAAKAKKGA